MRSALALALLLALGACALPQERSRALAPYQPIEAYITATTANGPLFHVNRPAYVAMFYIVPGGGVSMIYPGFGRGSLSGRVFAGSHFASNRLSNQQHFFFTRSTLGQPRYLFLIASDRPLDVEQFGTFGDGLLSRLGNHFSSLSPYSTMTELARLTLPSIADDGSWTSDMYVLWPSVIHDEPARGRVLVSCGDYAMYVPRGYVEVVRTVICEARENARPEEPQEGEAEQPVVRRPGAREPLPAQPEKEDRPATRAITAEQREAIRERVTSSSQLAAPRWSPEVGGGREEFGPPTAGTRIRPTPDAGRSTSSTRRSTPSGSTRATPAPTRSRPEAPSSASPANSGSRGPVTAPTARPSSDSDGGSGGGSSSRGPRSAPSAD